MTYSLTKQGVPVVELNKQAPWDANPEVIWEEVLKSLSWYTLTNMKA